MRPKLNDLEMLKFWLDAEITYSRGLLAVIGILLVEPLWIEILLGVYVAFCVMYVIPRVALVYSQDKEYLKIPKIDPDIVPRKDGR